MKKKTGLKTSGISLLFCLELGWVAKLQFAIFGHHGDRIFGKNRRMGRNTRIDRRMKERIKKFV